jgi:glycosyltransferase involved in cell wall biosynthesis
MTHPPLELSLVIPAYNEQQMIAATLETLLQFLQMRFESFEILVVDDGSTDETVHVVRQFSGTRPKVRLLEQGTNRGKGRAIQRGVQESLGEYILFMDADLPYDLAAVDVFMTALRSKYDLAIGSRHMPGSRIQGVPLLRYITGQVFSLLVAALMFPGIRDTQCGLKGFRAEAARQIFKRVSIRKFGFDVEALYIARKHKYAILPIPVQMTGFRSDSRVRLLHDSSRMFIDLFTIRWNDLRGKYD